MRGIGTIVNVVTVLAGTAALLGLVRRVPLLDVHFFVSAVMLQKRTGGNLAEILDKLAYIIRERFKLRGRIRCARLLRS